MTPEREKKEAALERIKAAIQAELTELGLPQRGTDFVLGDFMLVLNWVNLNGDENHLNFMQRLSPISQPVHVDNGLLHEALNGNWIVVDDEDSDDFFDEHGT